MAGSAAGLAVGVAQRPSSGACGEGMPRTRPFLFVSSTLFWSGPRSVVAHQLVLRLLLVVRHHFSKSMAVEVAGVEPV